VRERVRERGQRGRERREVKNQLNEEYRKKTDSAKERGKNTKDLREQTNTKLV